MARLHSAFFLAFTLAFSILPGCLAGPACARRNRAADNCIALCAARWGWPGMAMGTDPWGAVMKPDPSGSAAAKGCGQISAQPSTVGSVAGGSPLGSPPDSSSPPTTSNTVIPELPSTSTTVSTSVTSSSTTTHSASSTEKTTSTSSTTSSQTTSSTPEPTPTPQSTPPPPQPQSTSSTPQIQKPQTFAAPPPSPKSTQPAQLAASPAPTPNPISLGSTSNSDIQAYLSAHNSIRAQHGASPLTWSDTAAAKAQQWANNCVFKHSGGTLGPFGENLAAGTGDSYDIAAAVKSWTDEVSEYNPNNPQPSHFTQVVWKGSSQVGCAVSSCDGIFAASFGKAKFFVCEYSAQGNVIGQFAQNVQV